MSVYDFEVNLDGAAFSLKQFEGRVVVVVNTASRCSFSSANVEALNELVRETQGAVCVLGFPCKQFAQEPLSGCELKNWGLLLGLKFQLFDEVQVKGPNAHPLFKFLQGRLGRVHWNFTKYICDRQGVPMKRLEPGDVMSVKSEVAKLL